MQFFERGIETFDPEYCERLIYPNNQELEDVDILIDLWQLSSDNECKTY